LTYSNILKYGCEGAKKIKGRRATIN